MVKESVQKELTPEQLNQGRRVFDFLKFGKLSFTLSMVLVVVSVIIIFVKGFNLGLDFTGGTTVEMTFSKDVELENIRSTLEKSNFHEPIVQNYGSSKDVIIRISPKDGVSGEKLGNQLTQLIHQELDSNAVIKRVEFVGPSVGEELTQNGALAVLAALGSILIYIWFRFEWRLATGAVAALAHDVVITLGYLSLFQRELDLTIVASLLSVIGYSLNDTIVVFDRIRENFRKIRRGSSYDVINISLTQTLSRTLMTSGTTLAVVFCLYFFGGTMLQNFAETLAIGIFLGTISSIYVAAYIALKLGVNREHMLVPKLEEVNK